MPRFSQLQLAFCNDDIDDDIAFLALCQVELAEDGSLPEWIPLVPKGGDGGLVKALDGREFNNSNPQAVIDAFNADPRDLPLDWEHATEVRAPDGKTAPAAAWIDQLEIRDGGAIWGHVKEWTPKGAESVRNKEYRYISPAFLFKKATKVITDIISAGLVNRPALDMPAIARQRALAAEWTTAYINDLSDSAFLYVESGGKKDEDGKTVPRSLRHFPYKDESGAIDLPHLRNAIARIPQSKIPGLSADDLRRLQEKARRLLSQAQARAEDIMDREKLIKLLGLNAEATDDDITAAIEAHGADPQQKLEEVTTELETTKAKLTETEKELANARSASPSLERYVPRADYDAVVAREKKLNDEIEAGKKDARDKAVAAAIDGALKAGKIVPASKDQYVALCSTEEGFIQFKALVETLPKIAEPSDLDTRQVDVDPTSTNVTDDEKKIAASFNMTIEEYVKQRGEAKKEERAIAQGLQIV